ncbi:uncharacterized protein LOC125237122 [Leguminivora glycinivorella]|uniref:uncharacterized protein LOC125237122 n=1 Tax=Leguminivora glycinivorella TaxID=1035111 RepID=UPI00200C1E35|nr:uncharacterized protein LOC125237122 [Leguminivora glycinivorella]
MFKKLLVCFLFGFVNVQGQEKVGRDVCKNIEQMAEKPAPLPGKTEKEVKETAENAKDLMHEKNLDVVIDNIVAEAGGSIQIITTLSGANKGPTTLQGVKKLSAKKLSQVATKGASKLSTFIHKKLSAKLKGQDVDPDALEMVAQVAANQISKVGIAKLEARSNNQPKSLPPPNQPSSDLSDSGKPYQRPPSKKTMCMFTPPKEYCVIQMKNMPGRSEPEELNPPDVGVADEDDDKGVADGPGDDEGVADDDEGVADGPGDEGVVDNEDEGVADDDNEGVSDEAKK